MPLILPALLKQAIELPHDEGEWLFLWDLELERRTKTLPAVVFRFTSRASEIAWPVPGIASPVTFYPFPFTQGAIEQDTDANLPHVELAIDNTARVLMRHLHNGQGFEGNRATLRITHSDAVGVTPAQELRIDLAVSSAIAGSSAIVFQLEQVDLNEKQLPAERYLQEPCPLVFGARRCGYPITPTAAFLTCPRTPQACTERGDDEVARGLPRLHPQRYGSFPGLATQRTGGAG